MSCVFSGPSRAGKTTVVKRLKGEHVNMNENTPSTGIVDERGVVRIDIFPSSNVVTDQEWVEMEEDDEIQAFLNLTIIPQWTESNENLPAIMPSLITNSAYEPTIEVSAAVVEAAPVEAAPVEIAPSPDETQSPLSTAEPVLPLPIQASTPVADVPQKPSVIILPPVTMDLSQNASDINRNSEKENDDDENEEDTRDAHQETESNVAAPSHMSVLRRAQLHTQQIRATKRLSKRHFLYLSDTGGQPEFRKMIALLVPGPSNTFIVFRLCDEFDSGYPVRFCHRKNDNEIEYSSFSIKNTINDILEHLYCSELHTKVKGSIMFIGTHKDLITDNREDVIMRRNKELLLILRECPHYNQDMVIKSDENNIIFCVDNHTFENEHRCIRSSVLNICQTERFQVRVRPELLLLALTLKGAKVNVLAYDECANIAVKCGILKEDVKEALLLLHERLMMIRVYELNETDTIVVVKPKVLTNKVSYLLKFMITRNEKVYTNPVVSYEDLEQIATYGECMEADVLIKIFVHLLLIAPIPKSKMFIVPSMLPYPITSTEKGRLVVSTVPSVFHDPIHKSLTMRGQNELLYSFKQFKYSVPSTLHSPVLCSLLQDKHWKVQSANMYSDLSKMCIVFCRRMGSPVENVTFTVKFFKDCVSLYLGKEWNQSSISNEILWQCVKADQAVISALRQSMELLGYGIHGIGKFCLNCFEKHLSSADILGDCTTSHVISQVQPENIWFSKASI